jgi:transglutaminase-like putative cysteine protease
LRAGSARSGPTSGSLPPSTFFGDSRYADQFTGPARMLEECAQGSCAGDCDDHAALVAALAGAVGFRSGLRAYGPKNKNGYSHVYAVAYVPKRHPTDLVALDTTVPHADVGWQPPKGRVMTAVID